MSLPPWSFLPMGIGEPHCDRLVLVIFNLGDALVGRRLYLGDALPWRRFLVATLALGVSSPRRRLMLTLSPDVDFDLDFVNARIRDDTESSMRKSMLNNHRALKIINILTMYTR